MINAPYMGPLRFRFCLAVMAALDWIPGFCRYYTVPDVVLQQDWPPRLDEMQQHWKWHWRAGWGVRLLIRLNLIDAFTDECERRGAEGNPSSGS